MYTKKSLSPDKFMALSPSFIPHTEEFNLIFTPFNSVLNGAHMEERRYF